MTAAGSEIRVLLRALRRARTGEPGPLQPCPATLAPPGHAADVLTVADACRGLALALAPSAGDPAGVHVEPRAAEACTRFHGLGRLPEPLDAVAATLPAAVDRHAALHRRRARQLVVEAEVALEAIAGEADRSLPVVPSDDVAVDRLFDPRHPAGRPALEVLMRAWADVPEGDHRSATALLLFEQEAELRPPLVTGLHREARRRLRRRARAILAVAADRRRAVRAQAPSPADGRWRVDAATDLLLGGHHLVLLGAGSATLDPVLRVTGAGGASPEALAVAAWHVRGLVRRRAPEAAAALGLLRAALADRRTRAPAPVLVLTLSQATIAAREDDDPAGLVAADEACRLATAALPSLRGDARDAVVVSTLRTLQEAAELHARLWQLTAARHRLADAYGLLATHGDPEQEVEPDGWLQQLRYTESLVERRAAQARRGPVTVRAAYRSAREAVEITYRHPVLPRDRGLTAAAVFAQVATDEAVARTATDATGASRAIVQARRLVEANEADWVAHGAGESATGRSARLLSAVNACRLALAARQLDAFAWHRGRLVRLLGAASLQADAEELRALDRAAAAAGASRPEGARLAQLAGTGRRPTRAAAALSHVDPAS